MPAPPQPPPPAHRTAIPTAHGREHHASASDQPDVGNVGRHLLSVQAGHREQTHGQMGRQMGKVSVVPSLLPSRTLRVCHDPKRADSSRFWLLTTLMGLYTLHLKTLPSIQRRIVSLRSSSDLTTMIDPVLADEQLEKEAERRADMIERRKWEKELSDAKWTNRKLLADLVFVCESNEPFVKLLSPSPTGLQSRGQSRGTVTDCSL